MSGLPGYDAWKLASPPEYDQGDECQCGECEACKEEAAHDRHIDQKIDEAREREWDR